GWNANVDWLQRGDHLDVNFSGPLGVGSARVAGTPARLEVHTTEGEHFVTTDPENDLYWQLGWTAPLDRMADWVLGIPAPGGQPALEIDGAGRLVQLVQDGWTVDYIDYLRLDNERILPRKIEIRSENVRIRLIVSDWTLSKAGSGER
ncbi:MAG TPA: lipoprotein insertase outer membrane protein LolB, partial [Gammaproteobacteria bacterium]